MLFSVSIEQGIKLNLFSLRCAGLWPPEGGYGLNFYTLFAVVNTVFINIGLNIGFIGGVITNIDDMENITAAIFITSSSVMVVVKVYCMVTHTDSVRHAIQYREANLQRLLSVRRPETYGMYTWRLIYVLNIVNVFTTLLLLGFYPFLDGTYTQKRLNFVTWYPFDTDTSPGFDLTFWYQSVAVLSLGMTTMNVDHFFCSMMAYVGDECDELCDKLQQLEYFNDEEFNETLVTCALRYRDLVEICVTLSKVFSPLVAGQFLGSTIALAVTLFQVSVMNTSGGETITLLFYVSAVTLQIFILCWFCNEITVKSDRIPYSIFKTDWTETSLTVRKNLLFFQLRSQTPIRIVAFGLVELSLDTFKKILTTAWSYFTVLKQVHNVD